MIYIIFILPLLIILTGYLMFKHPPKKINYFIGYRTSKSMKNKKIWDFSHKYCGKLWINIGLIMFFLTCLLYLLILLKVITFTENLILIIVFGEISILLSSVLIVENKLKKYIGE